MAPSASDSFGKVLTAAALGATDIETGKNQLRSFLDAEAKKAERGESAVDQGVVLDAMIRTGALKQDYVDLGGGRKAIAGLGRQEFNTFIQTGQTAVGRARDEQEQLNILRATAEGDGIRLPEGATKADFARAMREKETQRADEAAARERAERMADAAMAEAEALGPGSTPEQIRDAATKLVGIEDIGSDVYSELNPTDRAILETQLATSRRIIENRIPEAQRFQFDQNVQASPEALSRYSDIENEAVKSAVISAPNTQAALGRIDAALPLLRISDNALSTLTQEERDYVAQWRDSYLNDEGEAQYVSAVDMLSRNSKLAGSLAGADSSRLARIFKKAQFNVGTLIPKTTTLQQQLDAIPATIRRDIFEGEGALSTKAADHMEVNWDGEEYTLSPTPDFTAKFVKRIGSFSPDRLVELNTAIRTGGAGVAAPLLSALQAPLRSALLDAVQAGHWDAQDLVLTQAQAEQDYAGQSLLETLDATLATQEAIVESEESDTRATTVPNLSGLGGGLSPSGYTHNRGIDNRKSEATRERERIQRKDAQSAGYRALTARDTTRRDALDAGIKELERSIPKLDPTQDFFVYSRSTRKLEFLQAELREVDRRNELGSTVDTIVDHLAEGTLETFLQTPALQIGLSSATGPGGAQPIYQFTEAFAEANAAKSDETRYAKIAQILAEAAPGLFAGIPGVADTDLTHRDLVAMIEEQMALAASTDMSQRLDVIRKGDFDRVRKREFDGDRSDAFKVMREVRVGQ